MDGCERCPVPREGRCLATADPGRFGVFCEWAASGDPVKVRHVVNRSAIGPTAPPDPTPRPLARARKPRIPLGVPQRAKPGGD
jgi:hypothetical protein